jgi:hypothetical protein
MHKSTPHIPTCIALDEVVNPQDLWDLVMEGEAFPEDESSQKAEEKGEPTMQTPACPNCVSLDEVVDPAVLWAEVLREEHPLEDQPIADEPSKEGQE